MSKRQDHAEELWRIYEELPEHIKPKKTQNEQPKKRGIPWALLEQRYKRGTMDGNLKKWYQWALKQHEAGKTDDQIRKAKERGEFST